MIGTNFYRYMFSKHCFFQTFDIFGKGFYLEWTVDK